MNHRQPSSFGHFQEELSSALANKVPVVPEARGEESRASSALQLQLSQSLLLEIAKPELYRLFAAKLAQRGLFLVGRVHDELIIEVPNDAESIQDVEELCRAAEREFLGGIDMSLGLENVPSARRLLRQLSEEELKDLERDLASGVFTANMLADKYQLRSPEIVQAYKSRLGLTKARGPHASVSHPAKDLSSEIEAAEARLAHLKAQAAEQGIKFEWAVESSILGRVAPGVTTFDGVVLIHGVGDHFRAAGGFAKFRAWVERQVPQIGAQPVEPPKLDPTSQLLAEEVTRATERINEHLSGQYVHLEDALDSLLRYETTPWVVTRTNEGISAIFATKELAEAYVASRKVSQPGEVYRASAWRVHRSLGTL